MYEAVKKFRAETQKKVVVSMASVAASGGYYVACAADKIFANPGTVTGSIGVIAEWYNYGDLLKWAKMQSMWFSRAARSRMPDLRRARSPKPEKAYFQSLIDNMYDQFVSAVASGRKMKEAMSASWPMAASIPARKPKPTAWWMNWERYQDAVAAAAKMAGIVGEPKSSRPAKKKILNSRSPSGRFAIRSSLNPDRSESHIRFEYLWR